MESDPDQNTSTCEIDNDLLIEFENVKAENSISNTNDDNKLYCITKELGLTISQGAIKQLLDEDGMISDDIINYYLDQIHRCDKSKNFNDRKHWYLIGVWKPIFINTRPISGGDFKCKFIELDSNPNYIQEDIKKSIRSSLAVYLSFALAEASTLVKALGLSETFELAKLEDPNHFNSNSSTPQYKLLKPTCRLQEGQNDCGLHMILNFDNFFKSSDAYLLEGSRKFTFQNSYQNSEIKSLRSKINEFITMYEIQPSIKVKPLQLNDITGVSTNISTKRKLPTRTTTTTTTNTTNITTNKSTNGQEKITQKQKLIKAQSLRKPTIPIKKVSKRQNLQKSPIVPVPVPVTVPVPVPVVEYEIHKPIEINRDIEHQFEIENNVLKLKLKDMEDNTSRVEIENSSLKLQLQENNNFETITQIVENLTVEKITKKGPRSKEYQCQNCTKKYKTKKKLYDHNYNVHRPKEKLTFQCQVCQKIFSKLSNLSRHSHIHAKERPFKCKFVDCECGFNQEKYLKSHILKCSKNPKLKEKTGPKDMKILKLDENIEIFPALVNLKPPSPAPVNNQLEISNINFSIGDQDQELDQDEIKLILVKDVENATGQNSTVDESKAASANDLPYDSDQDQDQDQNINIDADATKQYICNNPACPSTFVTHDELLYHNKTVCKRNLKSCDKIRCSYLLCNLIVNNVNDYIEHLTTVHSSHP